MSIANPIQSRSAASDGSKVGRAAGAIWAELNVFLAKARAVGRWLPTWLGIYLCALYVLLGLLVWWMPVDDFDTMASYLARIALERIGPLRQTATLEIQFLFPKFFDYLHAPLLQWGWFATLPNFALFTMVVAALVWRLPTAMAARIVLGLAACSPVIVCITSAKNDITLAMLSMCCWLWIYYVDPKRPWYVAGGLLIAAAMIGTKWHALVLAPMLMSLLGAEVVKARSWRFSAVLLTLCVLPLAWHMSSANVYLENLLTEGAVCPAPAYLHEIVDVPRNLAAFTVNNLLETFEVPFYLVDTHCHGKLWRLLGQITFGGKGWNYAILPTAVVSVYGFTMLVVIAAAVAALCRRHTPWPVRASALVALLYCAVLLCCFRYSTAINRYFLPTYVLGLVPCAYLAQFVAWPRFARWGFYAYLVFVSLQSLLLNQEKRWLPFDLYEAANDRYFARSRTLFDDWFDRDALQFHLWSGHLTPYRALRQAVRDDQQLLIVNCHEGNDCPFIYPFIKDRAAENTRIVNLRFGQRVPENLGRRFDYVLVFKGRRADAGFVPLFESDDVAVYQNVARCASACTASQASAATASLAR